MSRVDVVGLAARLAAAEPGVANRTTLATIRDDIGTMRSFLDALEIHVGLRVSELAADGKSEPAAGLLAGDHRRSTREI
nr:hypothetical protein [Acidimicrobiia bacterium]